MASENSQKILLKRIKNMKHSAFLSGFQGHNNLSYQFFETMFQQSVFPKL